MTKPTLAKQFAQLVSKFHRNDKEGGNIDWRDDAANLISALCKEHMPSGSGYNSGTTLDLNKSSPDKLVFDTAYHHMSENGYYTKWTYHLVTVTPSLAFDLEVKVSGRDYNQIKDYIAEGFFLILSAPTESE